MSLLPVDILDFMGGAQVPVSSNAVPAVVKNSKEWRRSKLCVVGEGRAGKTAFTNAMAGKTFEETMSTVGINQLACNVSHVKSSAGDVVWEEKAHTLDTFNDEDSDLVLSLFDFAGQTVFDVINHLFLTRNGVYALVFNMEWLMHDGPDRDRALRYMSNWLSSIAMHTLDKATQLTAPIVLVGTRLDMVPSPAVHQQISTLLYENFSDNLAWRSVLENENGKGSHGKAFQWFFPVDNTIGNACPATRQLMSVVHRAMDDAAYTHKQVPLSWFKLLDQMSDTKKNSLLLSEVTTIAAECGIPELLVAPFLSFLHDAGYLMWLDEYGLRDVVILDPISYLVTPATMIICKLSSDNDDPTHHLTSAHRECAKLYKKEWTQLKNDGVLSTKLLSVLWKDYRDHSVVLLQLMVKFGMLVPLKSEDTAVVLNYLVPSLLSPALVSDPNVVQWSGDAVVSSCYFVFTLAQDLESKYMIMGPSLKSAGFLPGGMFERIIGKAQSWSQDTSTAGAFSLQNVLLYKDMAVLAFGRQRFRLVHCADIHCVRVDIEGMNPIAVQQKLLSFITKIMDECMKSLYCIPAVLYASPYVSTEDLALTDSQTGLKKGLLPTELLIPLKQLRSAAAKGESMPAWRGGRRTLLSMEEIKVKYSQWLQVYDLRERYDVFVSYRWGMHDSDFTEALFDMLTNFNVGESLRAVEVFLDRKRLQEGRDFQSSSAAALTNTLVAVPVISIEALNRMQEHSPEVVDNVLLEWIMMTECYAAKRILRVYPIVFGARQGLTVDDFFSGYNKTSLPLVVPTATIEQAMQLLRANNVPVSPQCESYTVRSVVNDMLKFLVCNASSFSPSEVVREFSGQVVRILSDCGSEALNSVVTQIIPIANRDKDATDKAAAAATIARALAQGSKEWRRSKFSVVGEGRAGKTAFTNAVVGKTFKETDSTVGINHLTCDVKHVQTSAGDAAGEQQWEESKRNDREYEAALAQLMAINKRDKDTKPKGADIRDFMKAEADAKGSLTDTADEDEIDAETNSPARVVAPPSEERKATAPAPRAFEVVESQAANSPVSRAAVPVAKKLAPVKPVDIDFTAYNEEMIMKMLATMKDEESGLVISLFDFGGQAVFDVIHHLFLTRNGVYALVFNMQWLAHEGPHDDKDKALRFLRSWLSSIAVHTFDKATQTTAPIVLVGTHLDLVPDPAVHEQISTLLHKHFSDNLAWKSVQENENGNDGHDQVTQCFFPVDNKLGKAGQTMKRLMRVVHGTIDKAVYTHKQVPLTWFKLIDQMSDTKRDCLALSEVYSVAAQCGVSDPEVPLFLAFLHDMGHLMWNNEPELRDVVILDPVSYLVTPATIVICNLHSDKDDCTRHITHLHKQCAKDHKQEWTELLEHGVLDTIMLPLLWKAYFDHSHVLLLLMVKFGLLVPLRSAGAHKVGEKSSEQSHDDATINQYLVPTLLATAPVVNPPVFCGTGGALVSTCYFVFTLSQKLCAKSTILATDLTNLGFLPSGMFERLVGSALSWSQDTAKGSCIDLQSMMLYKDMAVLSFGQQRFRMVHCADIHCVRVDIEGRNPIAVQQRLLGFIAKIIDECMKSLYCFAAVSFGAQMSTQELELIDANAGLKMGLLPTEMLIPLQHLRKAATGRSMLTRGGAALLSMTEIKRDYGQWLQLYNPRESYDVFISYRWSKQGEPQYDSDFTAALFDMLTNFSLGEQNRAVEVFLDRKRLQDGSDFKSDFAKALSNTIVALPVVTMEALSQMQHAPEPEPQDATTSSERVVAKHEAPVDNLLLEWIMIIECVAAKRILKVYPILFGARRVVVGNANITTSVMVGNYFDDFDISTIREEVPTSTLAVAKQLLIENNVPVSEEFETYTIRAIIAKFKDFLCYRAKGVACSEMVESIASEVVRVVKLCGTDALDKVVAQEPAVAAAAAPAAAVVAAIAVAPAPPVSPVPVAHVSTPAQGTTSGKAGTMRKLEDLTVQEVCALLVEKYRGVAAVFAEKGVSGEMLSLCEQESDLLGEEFGVTSNILAKGVFKHVKRWKEEGVPIV